MKAVEATIALDPAPIREPDEGSELRLAGCLGGAMGAVSGHERSRGATSGPFQGLGLVLPTGKWASYYVILPKTVFK